MPDSAPENVVIRRFNAADVPAYLSIRREMLLNAPWAFGSSPEDDRGLDPRAVQERVESAESAIIGAFDREGGSPEGLCAVAGVGREPKRKARHLATIVGVYTRTACRGQGLGRRVVTAAIDLARAWSGVDLVQLAVSEHAPEARRLYERLGFVAWGVEPEALRLDGRAYAEIHMKLRLR